MPLFTKKMRHFLIIRYQYYIVYCVNLRIRLPVTIKKFFVPLQY